MDHEERFQDLKAAFAAVTYSPGWWWKVLIGGPMLFFPLTFLIPLGFTMEVLRRAKGNPDRFSLPSFSIVFWGQYIREGCVKLVIATGTLILPVLVWCGFSWAVAMIIKFPGAHDWLFFFDKLLPFAGPAAFFVTLPFCAVACCRYLETGRIAPAFDYSTNLRIYRAGFVDFSLGSVFLLGMSFIAQTWFVLIPWGVFFGLCVVDYWFGPIYNATVRRVRSRK